MIKTLPNGKVVDIPDNDLENLVEKLDLTWYEAIDLWLTDNGYTTNEEQEELDKKARASKITATIHEARADKPKTARKIERKEDATKESIIAELAEKLKELASEVKIENIGKLITFKIGEDNFKLDLTRTRKPKAKK